MRRFARAAVEPECPGLNRADPEQSGRRPGICGKACPYLVLICGFDGVQGLLAVTNWAAENDKAVGGEPVHERSVPGPAVLVPDLTRWVPAWAVDQPHREIGHDRSVRAIADNQSCPCTAGTQPPERPVIRSMTQWVFVRSQRAGRLRDDSDRGTRWDNRGHDISCCLGTPEPLPGSGP